MKCNFHGRDDLQRIHEASISILEKTGLVIHEEKTREMLTQHGFRSDGKRIYFEGDKVLALVEQAPSQIRFNALNPEHNLSFGRGNVHCTPGFGAAFVRDPDGTRRPGTVADYIRFARLGQVCPQIDLNGGVLVQTSEVPQDQSAAIMQYLALLFTDKCLIGHAPVGRETEQMMALLACATGTETGGEMPTTMMGVINCNTPLQYDASQLESMRVYLTSGQSVSINCGAMAGNTGPVTMAGAMALGNAEVLAGVAISQLMRSGAPVFYGLPIAQASDLQSAGTAIGGPESSIGTRYGAALAAIYGLPTRGCAGPTDAQSALSPQAAMEAMLLLDSNFHSGTDIVVHAAGIMDSYLSMSVEKYIMDCEILSMLDRVHTPVRIDEESLALTAIDEVGPGGIFLTHPHTFKNCRTEMFVPDLAMRGKEVDDFNAEYEGRVKAKLERLEAAYQAPENFRALKTELDAVLATFGIPVPDMD
ncbi:MAG: trimethylamine methyltransferase family protein [Desulfobacterales bacterium]|nr:trimethylamine methyltransferase family protein [Desulfobacterales bacterium]